jgi:hypothetical protein
MIAHKFPTYSSITELSLAPALAPAFPLLPREQRGVGPLFFRGSLRQVLGAGTPRQWKDLGEKPFLLFIYNLLVGKIEIGSSEAESQYLFGNRSSNHESRLAAWRGWSCRELVTSTPR